MKPIYNQNIMPTVFTTLPVIRYILLREKITVIHGHSVCYSSSFCIHACSCCTCDCGLLQFLTCTCVLEHRHFQHWLTSLCCTLVLWESRLCSLIIHCLGLLMQAQLLPTKFSSFHWPALTMLFVCHIPGSYSYSVFLHLCCLH